MGYNLELEKVTEEINKKKARTVCIQLPDGLKPKATKIADYLKEHTTAEVFLWCDSCFGSCDVPELDVDLLVHFGHTKWGELKVE